MLFNDTGTCKNGPLMKVQRPAMAKIKRASKARSKKTHQRLSPSQRRQQIVDAAIRYFSEVGFDGGTRVLAKKIGITQPLIFRYFPSKEDLIQQVYKDVYLKRWQPEWESLISNREMPLRDRLIKFYSLYTEAIFGSEWIRIYLFSGLRKIGINQWWISFIEEHILRRICEEIRHSFKLPSVNEIPIQKSELDLYWMFHGGIFYYGVRRHVYEVIPSLELSKFIELSVDGLLMGHPPNVRRVLEEFRLNQERNVDTERSRRLISGR
jgi:AcrR family transcriptional regulator